LTLTGFISIPEISLPVFYKSGFPLSQEESGFFVNTEIAVLPNLFGILIIIGGILIGCSKEKIEDEYISSLRLKSVFWSLLGDLLCHSDLIFNGFRNCIFYRYDPDHVSAAGIVCIQV